MIENLAAYDEYKPVRTRERHVDWISQVPRHWAMSASKWVFSPRDERARNDDQQLSATQAYGVIPQKEFERRVGRKVVQIVQHLDKRRHVEPDDFVISMRSFQGGLERAWAPGAIRSSYVVLKPSPQADVQYFAYLFKSVDYIGALQRTSNFIRDGQDLNYGNFKLVDLPVAPLAEQRSIAKFLRYADRRIRRYIRAKQKLIKLLEEQKLAIIHQAVTRGLDPNVRLKPSGVEWLGEVPEHWSVVRLRHLLESRLRYGANAAAEYMEPSWPRYLRITDFAKDGQLRSDTFRSLPPEVACDYLVEPGDVLLARSGATVGKAFLVPDSTDFHACHAGYLIRARLGRQRMLPEFFFAFTQSAGFSRWKSTAFIQATIHNISAEKYNALTVPVPPVTEQQAIVFHLNQETRTLARWLEGAVRESALMREYRTRLIADVVTGKLDVREAAANLPDDVDADEPEVDDADDIDDANELPDDEADE